MLFKKYVIEENSNGGLFLHHVTSQAEYKKGNEKNRESIAKFIVAKYYKRYTKVPVKKNKIEKHLRNIVKPFIYPFLEDNAFIYKVDNLDKIYQIFDELHKQGKALALSEHGKRKRWSKWYGIAGTVFLFGFASTLVFPPAPAIFFGLSASSFALCGIDNYRMKQEEKSSAYQEAIKAIEIVLNSNSAEDALNKLITDNNKIAQSVGDEKQPWSIKGINSNINRWGKKIIDKITPKR